MGKKCLYVAALSAGLVVLALWLGGAFNSGVIRPGREVSTRPIEPPARTARAEATVVPVMYEAVGTVRPKTETNVEAQVTGKVISVAVRPGDKVKRGDTLIVLDNRESVSRLERAEQGLRSAEAGRSQAREAINAARAASARTTASYKRIKTLFDNKVVASDDLDKAESEYLQAKARLAQSEDGLIAAEAAVRQAKKGIEEANINLGYATIVAPSDGEVAQRSVEPGDLAFPGKTLLLLQTGGALRLEALVREGVIGLVRPGAKLPVEIRALERDGAGDRTLGVVEEVVPTADPATRTFLVKVGIESLPGLYPGMFGRLLIPLRQKQIVLAPAEAVSRVGQLETVLADTGQGWEPIFVRTGEAYGDKVEILSGLWGNETLGLPDGVGNRTVGEDAQ